MVFGFTVTDGDTDTSTGSLTVKVNDDTPVGNTVVNTAATDDDVQLEFAGNANGTGDVADTATATGGAGSLFTAGADGFKSISFTPPTLSTVYKDANGVAQTETVTFGAPSVANGVTTLTGTSVNNGTVVTLVVNRRLVHFHAVSTAGASDVGDDGREPRCGVRFHRHGRGYRYVDRIADG